MMTHLLACCLETAVCCLRVGEGCFFKVLMSVSMSSGTEYCRKLCSCCGICRDRMAELSGDTRQLRILSRQMCVRGLEIHTHYLIIKKLGCLFVCFTIFVTCILLECPFLEVCVYLVVPREYQLVKVVLIPLQNNRYLVERTVA